MFGAGASSQRFGQMFQRAKNNAETIRATPVKESGLGQSMSNGLGDRTQLRGSGPGGMPLIGETENSSQSDIFEARKRFSNNTSGASQRTRMTEVEKLKPKEFRTYDSMLKTLGDGSFGELADKWSSDRKSYFEGIDSRKPLSERIRR
jgi:hypothetical protein